MNKLVVNGLKFAYHDLYHNKYEYIFFFHDRNRVHNCLRILIHWTQLEVLSGE